jgi:hypothetical protein
MIVEKQMECRMAEETNRSSRRKPAPTPLLSITKSHMTRPGFENPGRRGGKQATNRLSYGAAPLKLTGWVYVEKDSCDVAAFLLFFQLSCHLYSVTWNILWHELELKIRFVYALVSNFYLMYVVENKFSIKWSK